jgi:AraC-like DNA-binding protein
MPTAQGWVLSSLVRWLESRGTDATGIRNLPDAGNLADPDLRVPEKTMAAAWRLAGESTHDEAMGIHVAESLPHGAFDLVEYAVRASPSLGEGIERLAHYGRLISDRVAARIESHSRGMVLLVRDVGRDHLHPARADLALATALKTARECAGDDITPLQVSFTHASPADVVEHRRFFRTAVRFSAAANSMTFHADDVGRPMQEADPVLAAVVERRLDKILGEQAMQTGTLAERVRRLMVEHLGQAPLTPEGVADAVALSRRELSSRLAEEGTSFRALLDDVRREFACGLLLDRTLGVADIAFFLHYSEPAAFHRSFERWTSQTPSAFRKGEKDPTEPS